MVKRLILIGIIGITLVTGVAFLFDWLPFLRGGFGWRWPYEPPTSQTAIELAPGFLALAIYGFGVWGLRRQPAWLFLGWTFLGSIVIPLALLSFLDDPLYLLFTRTASYLTTGGFQTGAEIESFDVFKQWPSLIETGEASASRHIGISPPGWPIVYHLAGQILEAFPGIGDFAAMPLRRLQCDNPFIMVFTNGEIASAWIGIFSPLWGALTVLPLYFLGLQLGDDRLARTAVAWWPIVPSLTAFMATLNTPYPLMATSVITLLVAGLNLGSRSSAFLLMSLAGAFAAICLVFNFAFMPLLLTCVLLILLFCQRSGDQWYLVNWNWAIRSSLQFGFGFVIVLVLYRLLLNHHLLELLPIISRLHLNLNRPYIPWLWLHTWDFIIFTGIPVFGLFLLSAWILPPTAPSRKLAIGIALTLLIFVISGTARGETGRVWMFLVPPLLVVVAAVILEFRARWSLTFAASQLFWLLILVIVLRPVGTSLNRPPIYEDIVTEQVDAPIMPVDATFGDEFQLIGFQGRYLPESNSIAVGLNWKALKQMTNSYLFSILAVDPSGKVRASETWLPLNYQYPTTCWFPDKTNQGQVSDRIELELSEQALNGEWWFSLSAFVLSEEDTPIYLPVISPNTGGSDRQIGLGPVKVQHQ